jgi:hypothetical protein
MLAVRDPAWFIDNRRVRREYPLAISVPEKPENYLKGEDEGVPSIPSRYAQPVPVALRGHKRRACLVDP